MFYIMRFSLLICHALSLLLTAKLQQGQIHRTLLWPPREFVTLNPTNAMINNNDDSKTLRMDFYEPCYD